MGRFWDSYSCIYRLVGLVHLNLTRKYICSVNVSDQLLYLPFDMNLNDESLYLRNGYFWNWTMGDFRYDEFDKKKKTSAYFSGMVSKKNFGWYIFSVMIFRPPLWNVMIQIMTDHDFSWNSDGFSRRQFSYVTINHDSSWKINCFNNLQFLSWYILVPHDLSYTMKCNDEKKCFNSLHILSRCTLRKKVEP